MNKIIDTIDRYKMLKPNQSVVVGLSGGADSIMLCHFLKTVLQYNVIACHINHNLRGDESDRDMAFVREFCDRHSIKCYIYNEDVSTYAKQHRLSLELAGREIRYRIFTELASRYNAKIATAHTLSDSVETVLFNLARGSGIDGICGIQPVRGEIIRPLIFCKREDVERYCADNNLNYVTDSSNLTDIYTRNKIRLNAVPILKQVNQRAEDNIEKTIKTLLEVSDYLDLQAEDLLKRCSLYDGLSLDTTLLKEHHPALVTHTIKLFLLRGGIAVSYELINTVVRMLNEGNQKINVSHNVFVGVSEDLLTIQTTSPNIPYYETPCLIGEYQTKTGQRYRVEKLLTNNFQNYQKINKNIFTLLIDYDTIEGELVFRQRRSSDKITLANRNCTKTIKKLFNELKLSTFERSARFILGFGDEVVAVEGIGVNKRYEVTKDSKNILCISKV